MAFVTVQGTVDRLFSRGGGFAVRESWQSKQPVEITDDMVRKGAEVLAGPGFWKLAVDDARAVLSAALEKEQDA